MGRIEREAKVIRRRTNTQRIILETISTAGMLSLALLAPNALRLLSKKESGSGKRRTMHPKYVLRSAFQKVLGKGYIRFETKNGKKFVRLTKEGERTFMKMSMRFPAQTRVTPRRWDKRWRMIIYDIPEKRKSTRIGLQRTLRSFGFFPLQDSTWIYPYDCEELLILLKADLRIGRDVLYCVVEKIENDQKIKSYFDLQ